MTILDFFIVNVAVPSVQSDLHASRASIQFIVAAALLTPQVLAIVGTLYTGPHRARAFALYGMVLGLAGVFGQLIGGHVPQTDTAAPPESCPRRLTHRYPTSAIRPCSPPREIT